MGKDIKKKHFYSRKNIDKTLSLSGRKINIFYSMLNSVMCH